MLPPDMLGTVSCAVRRMTRQGRLLGKDERVDVYTALQGVTAYAAYQYHEERCKGTLQTGKTADMVILSRSPLEMPDELPPDIRIRSTIKAGPGDLFCRRLIDTRGDSRYNSVQKEVSRPCWR